MTNTDRAHPPDDTPLTLTLPLHAWTALRGAARWVAKRDADRAARRDHAISGRDLNAHRAAVLTDAADAIEKILPDRAF